jgi:predicted glycosyltransferase
MCIEGAPLMRVLIDIGHPAHVHFFRRPIAMLQDKGHDILVTSRHKEIACDLLEAYGIEHIALSREGGKAGLLGELVVRDVRLARVAKKWRPDVMAAIGGIFIAHAGAATRVPSLVFYDTENAKLQNLLTYPLATRVIVPRCYTGWTPKARTIRYPGYHELSYLRPPHFSAQRDIALVNGVAVDRPTYLVRLVAWKANHDIGERGLSHDAVRTAVSRLASQGKVLISAESSLPEDLESFRYQGDPAMIHHVMAHCAGFFGESATMASECAVLGVPAVYAANTGRGYTDEQEARYGLVHNARSLDATTLDAALNWLLSFPNGRGQQLRQKLLDDTFDVSEFVVSVIEARGQMTSLPVEGG